MKIIVLFFLSAIFLSAQTSDTLFVSADSVANKGIEINGSWKFMSGDSAIWNSDKYNDSGWVSISPLFGRNDSLNKEWKGIGWFRKYIVIDSTLFNKSVLMEVTHYGASEIYLDNKLVVEYGKVSANPDSEKTHFPHAIPVLLSFNDQPVHLMAVRYSNHRAILHSAEFNKWFSFAGFVIQLREVNKTIFSQINSGRINFALNFGFAGLFLSLSILYFILFVFYSKRKENLFYSIFALGLSVVLMTGMFGQIVYKSYTAALVLRYVSTLGILIVFLSFLGFLYSVFYDKPPKLFRVAIVIVVVFSIIAFLPISESLLDTLFSGFVLISVAEGIRIMWVAYRQKKPNVNVIGTGVIIFLAFLLIIVLNGVLGLRINNFVMLGIFTMGLFSVPASMSVYLARDIAETNKNLQQQLVTIKDLSQKEIEIEKKNAELKILAERERAENERKSKELEEARQLQLSLLPKTLPELPHLDIAVYMQTATEVGGDYYDFHVGIDGTLTVAAGDATGHGLNAGTMVTATKSLFSTHAENPDIISTFTEMSRCIKDLNFKLLSMCLMILKIQRNKLIMSSAGMPPALLYRHKTNTIEEIILRGMPLGTATAFPYKVFETEFEKGDTLLLMSDGFPELFNDEMEMFGYQRTSKEFLKLADKAPDEIIDGLKKEVNSWVGDKTPQDDVTFVVLKAN